MLLPIPSDIRSGLYYVPDVSIASFLLYRFTCSFGDARTNSNLRPKTMDALNTRFRQRIYFSR